jgi:ElaB/YqjD/DUF883 family membrane-anchored ribosome-binding protein
LTEAGDSAARGPLAESESEYTFRGTSDEPKVENAMSEMSTNPKDKLMSDLKVVIADTEELLQVTAGQVGDKATALRTRVQENLAQAKVRLADLQDAAVAKAKAAGNATDDFVHDNPWKSVGIAAGVGLVVGLLIGRR